MDRHGRPITILMAEDDPEDRLLARVGVSTSDEQVVADVRSGLAAAGARQEQEIFEYTPIGVKVGPVTFHWSHFSLRATKENYDEVMAR